MASLAKHRDDFLLEADDRALARRERLAALVGQHDQLGAPVVGLPECALNLAQAAAYLALAPKSNAATVAIGAASRVIAVAPLQLGGRRFEPA